MTHEQIYRYGDRTPETLYHACKKLVLSGEWGGFVMCGGRKVAYYDKKRRILKPARTAYFTEESLINLWGMV